MSKTRGTVTVLPEPVDAGEMSAVDVLRAAADKLMRDGWAQGSGDGEGQGGVFWNNPNGTCCVRGAMCVATRYQGSCWADSWFYENEEAARALETFVDVPIGYIPVWNDAPERTADEVIDALLACAADLEAGTLQSRTAGDAA